MGRLSNLEGSGDQDSSVEPDVSELSQQPGRRAGWLGDVSRHTQSYVKSHLPRAALRWAGPTWAVWIPKSC